MYVLHPTRSTNPYTLHVPFCTSFLRRKQNTITRVSNGSVASEDSKPHTVITQDASYESSFFVDEKDDIPLAASITKQSKRAFKPITMGAPKREDEFGLPAPTTISWKWEPPAGKNIVVMKDYALAVSNAV